MEDIRISVGSDVDGVAAVHEGEIVLVNVDQDPDGAHVRDGETLRGTDLEQLARSNETFDDLATDWGEHGNLRGSLRRAFDEGFKIFEAQRAQSILARLYVGLGLGAVGFCLLEVALGDSVMFVEVDGALVILIGKLEGGARFQVSGTGCGIVGTPDRQAAFGRRGRLARVRRGFPAPVRRLR